jgi:hypothetical protein
VKAIVESAGARPRRDDRPDGIFPRNDNMAVMPAIDRINQQLATFADGKRVRFLNINDRLPMRTGCWLPRPQRARQACTRLSRAIRSGPMR